MQFKDCFLERKFIVDLCLSFEFVDSSLLLLLLILGCLSLN